MQTTIKFDASRVSNILSKLGIKCDTSGVKNSWMGVLCKAHSDRNLGNAFINVESGVTHCFSCGAGYSLYTLVTLVYPSYTPEQVYEFLGYSKDYIHQKSSRRRKTEDTQTPVHDDEEEFSYSLSLETRFFHPNDFEYTKSRGYTEEFIKHFRIKYVTHGFYKGYIAIPIEDANTYEFRKVDPSVQMSKVLYPKGVMKGKPIIWNQSYLDKNQDLFVCEGISTCAKIWKDVSKNVTSVFGSNVSDFQIEVLKQFARIIIVPDNDDACAKMVNHLGETMESCYVADIKSDDEDESFVSDLQTCKYERPSTWLQKYYGLEWSFT